jgi:mono/diheme cytochrome c family protein
VRRSATRSGILLFLAALFLACGSSRYEPSSEDPGTIYLEACAPCHRGGTSGPSLAGRRLAPGAVEAKIARGARGMPAFPGIKGEARRALAEYVSRISQPDSAP